MKLKIILEHRFFRTPDGSVWTEAALPYSVWQPYLKRFTSVNVIARIHNIDQVSIDLSLSSGPGVTFTAVPYFIGPRQFLLKFGEVRRAMQNSLNGDSAVLLRIPGTLGTVAYRVLKASGQPYGAQIVADPHQVFAPGGVRHPLRFLFRWWFTRQLKTQARHASVISYVTRVSLQERYPSQARFSNSFSNVQLPAGAFVDQPRSNWDGLGKLEQPYRLILVGSLAQLYKSPDVILRAIAICADQGLHLHLTIVGDGRHRSELENLARELKVQDQVTFAGQLSSGDAVREELDRADIFVLPSRTEGLPRAMIEAMARAMPCIGSTVGGIPELLPAEDMVPPGDAPALAQKLQEVAISPQRLREMSHRNLETAHSYADSVLARQRQDFYECLALETEAWQGETRSKSQGRK
ncbi:glycosyltransferase family 4 protein [Deinococcus sp. KSM4-11]|uniref:glycosyltransferase n=1 Tax=Deinococcus sp. KSM4-11 TaxID=2568654 RepID=UPI0010A2B8F1|nr:glycosyltransferase [Deinococcus sp. KSM4-11]THF87141.1 glycosyltransferase family 4 protein [Deinococcus sp. KSM4-11]